MKEKRTFYTEAAYVIGILGLALGTAFMERADFGVSMVVAPAYLLHLKISQFFPFYSFGMSEYMLQLVLLVALTVVMKKFKKSYLFSFVTAVFYGAALDAAIFCVALVPENGFGWRCMFYAVGMLLCAFGVACLFRTYIAPEAYELFVKEYAAKRALPVERVKTVYDCCSCAVGVVMSFLFFGFGVFEGVKLGTIFCALVNGWMIGVVGAELEKRFDFRDALPYRGYFEKY